jgi:hypothetical protein
MNIMHINALYTWGSKYGKELATDFVALAFAGIPAVRAPLGSVNSRSLPDDMKNWFPGWRCRLLTMDDVKLITARFVRIR